MVVEPVLLTEKSKLVALPSRLVDDAMLKSVDGNTAEILLDSKNTAWR